MRQQRDKPNMYKDLRKPQKRFASLELERPGAKTLKNSGHAETKVSIPLLVTGSHVAEKREKVKVGRVRSAAERGDRKPEDRTYVTTGSMSCLYSCRRRFQRELYTGMLPQDRTRRASTSEIDEPMKPMIHRYYQIGGRNPRCESPVASATA